VRVDASCGSGFVGGEPAGLLEFDGYRHGLIEVDCHRCRELAGDLQTLHHHHDVESVGDDRLPVYDRGRLPAESLLVGEPRLLGRAEASSWSAAAAGELPEKETFLRSSSR
jgi:hypothetical protein